jgi:20S proteasome alpha/beta subunit
LKLEALPSTDREQALKNATAVIKSKKPRMSEEDAINLAHEILTASCPSISAGTIMVVAETEKDFKVRNHLANKAIVQRESARKA